MSKRGYNLSNAITTWDDDVFFNVDKSGFSEAKQYKASVLKGHMKVGDQSYTEENYVTDSETLTESVDALDMALKNVADNVSASTIKNTKISLTSADVAALGTAYELLPALGSGKAYQIFDVKYYIDPATVLDVGSQNLELYFDGISLYFGLLRNDKVEKSAAFMMGVQVQPEHEVGINAAVKCKLSASTNPVSGSATMTFWITYAEIEI